MPRGVYEPMLCAGCGVDTRRGPFVGAFWGVTQREYFMVQESVWANAGRQHQSEFYMVTSELWAAAGMDDGFLCIGCLEERIGRQLTAADFTDCRANLPSPVDTPRLAARKIRQPPRVKRSRRKRSDHQ